MHGKIKHEHEGLVVGRKDETETAAAAAAAAEAADVPPPWVIMADDDDAKHTRTRAHKMHRRWSVAAGFRRL